MEYTDAQLLNLDPELSAIFKKRGRPRLPLPTRDNVIMMRTGFAGTVQRFNNSPFARSALGKAFEHPTWREIDYNIPLRDNRSGKIRLYVPHARPAAGAPVLVFLHSGGWFMGDLDTEALLCRAFCAKMGMLVINVAFGLHPEVPFGVPQNDCYDACRWTSANISSQGGDPKAGFIIGGNSGGCTWGSTVVRRWADNNERPPITGSFYLAPIFTDHYCDDSGKIVTRYDHDAEYRSWSQCKDAPLMNDKMREGIGGLVDMDYSSSLLSPLMFPNFEKLPPTYVAVCGIDPWRDGGIIFARELQRSGQLTKVDIYPGLLHCWWTTFPQIHATQTWLTNCLEGMRWLLQNQVTDRGDSKL